MEGIVESKGIDGPAGIHGVARGADPLDAARHMGYAAAIEEAGGLIVCDTCPAHTPSREMAKKQGYRTLTTDSAKMAHDVAGEVGFPTHYGSTEKVIAAAISKRWRGEIHFTSGFQMEMVVDVLTK